MTAHFLQLSSGALVISWFAKGFAVQVGDLVRSGQEIAKAGSSGRSTGAHVHFEVWQDGAVVNPRKFLAVTSSGAHR